MAYKLTSDDMSSIDSGFSPGSYKLTPEDMKSVDSDKSQSGFISNFLKGIPEGVAEFGRGSVNLQRRMNEPQLQARGMQPTTTTPFSDKPVINPFYPGSQFKQEPGVISREEAGIPESKGVGGAIGEFVGGAAPALALPEMRLLDAPKFVSKAVSESNLLIKGIAHTLGIAGKNALVGSGLSPLYMPDTGTSSAMTKGAIMGALGAPAIKAAGATAGQVPKLVNTLLKMGGTRTPEEIEQAVAQAPGGQIPLGEAIGSPMMKGFQSSMLAKTPFSGMAGKYTNLGKALTEPVKDVLNKFEDNIQTNSTDDIVNHLSDKFKENRDLSRQKYEKLNDLADSSIKSKSYRMSHGAPEKDGLNTADNLSEMFPDDIYDKRVSQQYYGDSNPNDKKSLEIISDLKGKPNKTVEIYRAVPKDVKKINAGDWVTINKNYAADHGELYLESDHHILSKKVKAKDLATDANSIHEWGYSPAEPESSDSFDYSDYKSSGIKALKAIKEEKKAAPEWDAFDSDAGKQVFKVLSSIEDKPLNGTFKAAGLTDKRINDFLREARSNNDNNSIRIIAPLKEALDRDYERSAKNSDNPEVYKAWKDAKKFFKDNVVPLQDKDILKFIKGKVPASQITQSFVKKGGSENPEKLSKLTQQLPENLRQSLAHHFLTKGRALNTPEDLNKAMSEYGKLGPRSRKVLFTAAENKTIQDSLDTSKLLGAQKNQLFIPKTGEMGAIAKGISGAMQGAAGMATYAGHYPAAAALAATIAAPAAVTKAIMSPAARNIALKATKRLAKSADKNKKQGSSKLAASIYSSLSK